jgi:superfamily II DNA/RNA helicase
MKLFFILSIILLVQLINGFSVSGKSSFASLTVPELKDILRSRGLAVSGNKSELVERLIKYDESNSRGELKDSSDNWDAPSFDKLGIFPPLLESIQAQDWYVPTPVQQLCIPEILSRFKDSNANGSIWAEAPTGSGKTAAFALPIIQLIIEDRKSDREKMIEERKSGSITTKFQRHLSKQSQRKVDNTEKDGGFVNALILVPTRELAIQIGGVIEELVEGMPTSGKGKDNVSIAVITGGVPMEPQIQMLTERKRNNENIDILVATPGRLADVLSRSTKEDTVEKELENRLLMALDTVAGKKDGSLSLAQLEEMNINKVLAENDDGGRSAIQDVLQNLRYLVFDEADRLLSPGFKSEMDEVLQLITSAKSSQSNVADGIYRLKTLLFSATFPEQYEPRIEKVLQRLGGRDAPSPIRISCSAGSSTDAEDTMESNTQKKRRAQVTQPQLVVEGPESTIKLRTIRIEEPDRTQALRKILNENDWDRVLIFVGTRYASEHVAKKLRRYNISATELHGKLDQDARSRRLNDFKRGKVRVLLATDLASRGLDVAGLPAVINYDLPRSTADFVHRIGRTGRAGNKGEAISFVSPTNVSHFDLIEKRHIKGIVPKREVLKGFEPKEDEWEIKRAATVISADGVQHSSKGLAHDRMFGGVKGHRKSKKDRAREAAARKAQISNNKL